MRTILNYRGLKKDCKCILQEKCLEYNISMKKEKTPSKRLIHLNGVKKILDKKEILC
jgi:hypothetical protein